MQKKLQHEGYKQRRPRKNKYNQRKNTVQTKWIPDKQTNKQKKSLSRSECQCKKRKYCTDTDEKKIFWSGLWNTGKGTT